MYITDTHIIYYPKPKEKQGKKRRRKGICLIAGIETHRLMIS